MDLTYASPLTAEPARARLVPSRGSYTPKVELVQFFHGQKECGIVTLPRDAAYELISRLEDTPPTLTLITAEVAEHVRYVLDRGFRRDTEPDPWVSDLILLIESADEDRRRLLGRAYPAYVVAVAIATGPGGLEALQALHEELLKATSTAAPRAAQGG
jgi:hypothetical protein